LDAALRPLPNHIDLTDTSQVSADLECWARRAFFTLERYANGEGESGTRPGQLRDGKWGHKWEEIHRHQANDLYIRPILAHLESQTAVLAAFHAGIERWVQRQRWFGDPTETREAFYQEDFARFLFDRGFDLPDIGRETYSAGGWVDFLLRGAQLVPVEFKRWRGPQDNDRLSPTAAPAQASRYASDFRVSRVYLIVVSVSTTHRLALPDTGRTADGTELLIRLAEVRPPAPTQDARTPMSFTLADLGLG
jgi:hypothetical protein